MPDRQNFPTNKNVVTPPKPPIWPFRSKFVSLSMRRYTNGRPSVHRNTGRTAAPPHETMKNSKPIAITLMSILSLFGCGPSKAPEYPSDQLTARDGTRFTITFFKHASLSIEERRCEHRERLRIAQSKGRTEKSRSRKIAAAGVVIEAGGSIRALLPFDWAGVRFVAPRRLSSGRRIRRP